MERIPIRQMKASAKEPDRSRRFSILDLKDLLDGKDMVQEIHRHDFFYVLVLKKGKGSHDIDFTSYTVCDNSVFFMRPGQVHEIALSVESIGYLLQFSAEFYFPNDSQLLYKAARLNHYQFNKEGIEKLLRTSQDMLQEYTDRQEKYEEAIKANMGVFLIELIRLQPDMGDDQTKLYMLEQVEQFTSLLERDVFEHKQVSYYADMLNISIYQLNTITKNTLGKTCSTLINEHLILEAKRYLLATSNQVNQIAFRLGYTDVSYFIRFFKKHAGHSPEAFRHNFR